MPSSPQALATVVVFDYLEDSQGKPLANRQVTITLDFSGAIAITPPVFVLQTDVQVTTDQNGYWQAALVPQANITPAGTVYIVQIAGGDQYQISVPSSGPVQSSSILANQPSVLSPALTGLTGPITVTGNETVTGNLAVNGTTSLAGLSAGATTLGATTLGAANVGGDLTIASAFRLLFGAVASKIVPGATSMSLRNHADSADNLLVTDAGLVTARAGLAATTGDVTVTAGRIVLGAAAGKIVPGATSVSLRNNADNADNLIITDAGVATLRGLLTTQSSPYHAEVYLAVATNISSNTVTVIPFDTAESDPNGNFTLGAGAKYTCPASGRYLVTAGFVLTLAVTGVNVPAYFVQVAKNGTEARRGDQWGQGTFTVNNPGSVVSSVVRANAGDTLDIRGLQITGGVNTFAAGANLTYAQFTYIGAL